MLVRTLVEIIVKSGKVPSGKIINIPPDIAERLGSMVERVPPACRLWKQVCHAVGMYQDQCTGTGGHQCTVFRFLEKNTKLSPQDAGKESTS